MDRLPGWIDRERREPTSYPAVVMLADGRRLAVTITNISHQGCQVQCKRTLPIGQSVKLELAGSIKANASVRWAVSGTAGLRFHSPFEGEAALAKGRGKS